MENLKHATFKYITVTQLDDEIVLLERHEGPNTATADYIVPLEEFVSAVRNSFEKTACRGIIYTSPLGSEDIDWRYFYHEMATGSDIAGRLHQVFKEWCAMCKMKKPIVSIIDGDCFSLCLATALWGGQSIATSRSQLGFPEFKYGLFPGFGASTFSIRKLGMDKAVPFLFQGNSLSANEARNLGLIDEVVPSFDKAIIAAKTLIISNEDQSLFFNSPTPIKDEHLSDTTAIIRKKGKLVPAHANFLELLPRVEKVTLEEALKTEIDAWLSLWQKKETISMVRTMYYSLQEAKRASIEHNVAANFTVGKIGILGAGIMGSGIAYEAARAGLQVYLKDVTLAYAERGKGYAETLTQKQVAQGKMISADRDVLLDHIQPTENASDLIHSDIIIEAVFEDKHLKSFVTKEALPFLSKDGIFASNTTSLPIGMLASVSPNPENFIGMHFFSPVDRMPLVEIIRGPNTSQSTLGKALLLARKLNKVPIVVFDGPAFFTSRIFFNYLLEAVTMVLEGVPASIIEQEAKNAGFAIGPLAVLDEISLKLMLQVYDQLPALHPAQQRAYTYLETLIGEGRNGRKTHAGFYNYDKDAGTKVIWNDPTLPQLPALPPDVVVRQRLLHIMALDSYRCLDEGILSNPSDGDLGSILGVGYAVHTGGVFGHIDQVGIQTFVQQCSSFLPHGEQWLIPASLKRLAEDGYCFYKGFDNCWK
ncbi:3-hydroxyacyl-CoA dehydrogenase NAD-binding domain-containing protein [Sphingobacterium deserti]|uniref:Fatty oxidation complex alpha subunit n=1 Tax=Sphingobacterium deserti TaxID=1229276 RepID=A0A0B8T3C9_9SPHI|nr:3-hydroxyacyl-CoA dehydrogenase NAD-binding domain-containing protein [Sphingobacterium deserti]KGE16032.1 fatty oxidation complex alpha subunit [Sphingobacterium deserti]